MTNKSSARAMGIMAATAVAVVLFLIFCVVPKLNP